MNEDLIEARYDITKKSKMKQLIQFFNRDYLIQNDVSLKSKIHCISFVNCIC